MTSSVRNLATVAAIMAAAALPLEDASAQATKKGAAKKASPVAAEVVKGTPLSFITQVSEGVFPLDLVRRSNMQVMFLRNLDTLDQVDKVMVTKALSALSIKVDNGVTSFPSNDANIIADRARGAADLFGETSVMLIIRDKVADRTIYITQTGSIGIQTGVKLTPAEMRDHLRSGQGFLSLAMRGHLMTGDAIRVQALVPRFWDASFFGQPGSVASFKLKEGAVVTPIARQLISAWPKSEAPVRDIRELMTQGRDGSLRAAAVKPMGMGETFIDTNDAANMQIRDFIRVLPKLGTADFNDLVAYFVASANTRDGQSKAFRALRAALADEVTKGAITGADAEKVAKLDEARVMRIAKGIHDTYGAGFDRDGFGLMFRSAVAFFQPDDDAVAADWARAGASMSLALVAATNAGVLERVCTTLGVSNLVASRLCAYIATDRHNQSAIDAIVAVRALDAMTYQLEKFQIGQDSAGTMANLRGDQNRFMREVLPTLHAVYLFANSEGQTAGDGWAVDYDRAVSQTKRVLEAVRTREIMGYREGYDTAMTKMMADMVGIFRTDTGIDLPALESYLEYAVAKTGLADLKLLRHLVRVAQQKEQLGKGVSAPSVTELYGPNALTGKRSNYDQNAVQGAVVAYVQAAKKLADDTGIPAGANAEKYREASMAVFRAARLAAISKRGTVILPAALQAN